MAITKRTENDSIEVAQTWAVNVRKATVIEEDGVELSRTFHRHMLVPGTVAIGETALVETDISGEDADVQSICNAAWTSTVKENFRKWRVEQNKNAPGG